MTKGPAPSHTLDDRNAAILEFYPLIERIARRIAANYGTPTGMDTSDLVSHGVIGLVEAYERFDADRGVPFETFAIPRIKGAIVDSIRHSDWVPRKVRTRVRKIDEATTQLTSQLGRAPTNDEVSDTLGMQITSKKRQPKSLLALDASLARDGNGGSLSVADTLVDLEVELPGEAIEDAELRTCLLDGMHRLHERDRFILTLYYFEQVPLTDISQILGVTESRVSQIHMRALRHLKEGINAA